MTASAAEAAFQQNIIRELVEGGWVEGTASGQWPARPSCDLMSHSASEAPSFARDPAPFEEL